MKNQTNQNQMQKKFCPIVRKLLLGIFLFCTACESSQTDNDSLKILDITDLSKTEVVKASDIDVVDIEYISLETDTNSLISFIRNIKSDDNFLYIRTSDGLLRFDLNGKFISKIGKKGRGPQEYQILMDYSIGADGNIYILSLFQEKIFIYTPKGDFVRTIPAPFTTYYIECFEDGILCYSLDLSGSMEKNIHALDYSGNILKEFSNKYLIADRLEQQDTMPPPPPPNFGLIPLFRNEDKLFLKEFYSDTVFLFNQTDLVFEPAFILDRGGRLITLEAEISGSESRRAEYIEDTKIIQFGDKVYAEFIDRAAEYSKYGFYASFDKSRQYLMSIDEHGIINDIDGGPSIWMKTPLNRNTVISWIDAFELIAFVNSDEFKNSTPKYPEKKKELEKLAKSLDENDNPILMLVRFKE